MIQIFLTQGKVAIVDDEDAELARLKWCAYRHGRTFYAQRAGRTPDGRQTMKRLHRVVWQRAHPDEDMSVRIDHWNGDGLDCRRGNLRPATRSQNQHNQRLARDNASGYKGVDWVESRGRWRARIRANDVEHHLGYFETKEVAAKAYDCAARTFHQEFATLNFPEHGERAA